MTYEDFQKLVKAGMLDANGRFLGPQAGVNYQAEGMSPEQFFKYQNEQVGDPNARDGHDAGFHTRGPSDPGWTPGAIDTKAGALGNWGPALAMLAMPFAAGAMGAGAAAGGTAEAGAGFSGMGGAGGSLGAAGDFGAGTYAAGAGSGVGSAVGTAAGANLGLGDAAATAAGTVPEMTLAEQMAAYGAGGGGITGGLSTGTVGAFTGAAGGDLVGTAAAGAGAGSGILESLSQLAKDNPLLTKIAGSVIGAGLGAAASKDSQTTQTSSKDPWAPAQPYLLDNLKTNAAMQAHYAADPFSAEQKTAYQGLLNNLANNSANMPGLLTNASSFGQSKHGVMPAMQGLLSGTQAAPIDWNQYQNIGRAK